MSIVKTIATGSNFKAISSCPFNELLQKSQGKLFIKDAVNATSAEISLSVLPPKVSVPFIHTHKQNEELYVIQKGEGQMQIDGKIFNVKEGDVIRVSPHGKRCIRASETQPLTFLCIQAKENSLEQYVATDANILKEEVSWE